MSGENGFHLKRNPNGSKRVGQKKLRMLLVFKREMGEIRKILFPERIIRIKKLKN